MKKNILLVAGMILMITAGSAFAEAGNENTKKTNDTPYNGITYFDLSAASAETTVAVQESEKTYNGITYFEMTGSRPVPLPKEEQKAYNGVTYFG